MEGMPVISLPFTGYWASVNSPGHDRYAFDFVASAPGRKRKYFSKSLLQTLVGVVETRTWVGWSQPILAPCDGTVIEACDGWPDQEKISLLRDVAKLMLARPKLTNDDIRPFAGNYVIIEFNGFYAFLAHMRRGSVKVSQDETIEVGQIIGEVGHSGLSLAPHIHFQVMDGPNLLTSNIIPFQVREYELLDETWKRLSNATLQKGVLLRTPEDES